MRSVLFFPFLPLPLWGLGHLPQSLIFPLNLDIRTSRKGSELLRSAQEGDAIVHRGIFRLGLKHKWKLRADEPDLALVMDLLDDLEKSNSFQPQFAHLQNENGILFYNMTCRAVGERELNL